MPAWAAAMIEWHAPAGYILAVVFTGLRWCRLKFAGHPISLGSVIHQAATGFVLPAFILLCGSYLEPSLSSHISPHEMGIAGLFATLVSLRELVVNGRGDEGRNSSTA